MAWTAADISFKTLLNKRQSDSGKQFYEEFGDFTINTHIDETWYNSVPSDASTLAGVTEWYASHTMKVDPTVSGTLTWAAVTTPGSAFNFSLADDPTNPRLKDWISDKYGAGYDLKLFSNGTQISKSSATYPWRFNYATGELTFNSAAPATPITIVGYRYIGKKGLANVFLKEASLGTGFTWNGTYLDISAGSGDVTKLYVDGSLAFRDVSINNLYINLASTDTSLLRLDGSVNIIAARLFTTDSSLNTLTTRLNTSDSSLNTLRLRHNVSEVSLGVVSDMSYANNVSLNTVYPVSSYINSSSYYDSSLANIRAIYIPNSSFNQSTFKWVAGYLEPSVATGDVTKAYVDGSLATLNSSINYAFLTNVSLGLLSITSVIYNTSIGTLTSRLNITDTSLSTLNTSVGRLSASSIVYNSSIGILTTKVNYIDACLGTATVLAYATNSSISAYATNSSVNTAFASNSSLGILTTRINYIDASLEKTSTLTYALNASISAYSTNASIASVDFVRGVSLNDYITNASIAVAKWLKESSLGTSFLWTAGILDVSLPDGGVTQSYVDTADNTIKATYIKSTSTGIGLYWNAGYFDVSVNGGVSQYYVDGSLSTLNASVNTALYSYTTNASIALIDFVKGVSLNAYATNSSVNLAFASNVSLGNLTTKVNYIDASLGRTSTLTYALNASISAYATNASVNTAFASNASLGTLTTKVNYIDASLGMTSVLTYALNSSISSYATNASIAAVDFVKGVSLNAYATNSSVNLAFASNSSLGTLTTKVNYIDSCLGTTSALVYATNTSLGDTLLLSSYVDSSSYIQANFVSNASLGSGFYWNSGSLDVSVIGGGGISQAYVDGSISALNASVNIAFLTNASLGTLTTRQIYIDACLGTTSNLTYATNTSIGLINASLNSTFNLASYVNSSSYYDGSLNRINASLNDIWPIASYVNSSSYYDSSLNNITSTYIKSASIGTGLYWNAGQLDVSVVGSSGVSQAYVDASLNNVRAIYIPDSSLNQSMFKWVSNLLEPSVVGGTSSTTLAALTDVSIVSVANNNLLKYDSSWGKWMNVAPIDASSYFYTKIQIDASFITGNGKAQKIAFFDASKNLIYDDLILYDGSTFRIGALNAATNASTNPSKFRVHQTNSDSWNIAAFTIERNNYAQVRIHNDSDGSMASGDFVVEADNATEETNFIDLGINNSQYDSGYVGNSNDGYLYSSGKNLLIGNIGTDSSDHHIIFFSGGSDVYTQERMRITADGRIEINQPGSHIYSIEAGGDINVPFGSTYRIDGQDIGIVDVNKSYVDSSLLVRDGSITALFAKTAAQEASLGDIWPIASYVESSTYNRAIYIADASLNQSKFKWIAGILEPSVAAASDTTIIEASLYTLTLRHNVTEVSLGAINASLNDTLLLSSYVDSSSYIKANFVRNASLSPSYFNWNAGILEASVAGTAADVTKAYVDGSLATRDASISDLYSQLGGGAVTFAYVDASLAVRDSSITALFIKTAQQDASLNSSFNLTSYVDSSSVLKATFVSNVSLNTLMFKWNNGFLEPSISATADVTKEYVDGSLATRDTSIVWIINNVIKTNSIGIVIDGAGTAITTGSKGYREIDANYNITNWTLLSDVSGSIIINLKTSTYELWPVTTKITLQPPELISNNKNTSTNMSAWITSVSTGDILEFDVSSATTLTKAWLTLTLTPR